MHRTHKNTPEVNEHKEDKVQCAMQGEQVDEKMIGYGLQISVHRMERMGRKRCWDFEQSGKLAIRDNRRIWTH